MEKNNELKGFREFLGFSLRTIAGMIGVSHVAWWKYEQGVCKPSKETFKKITCLSESLHYEIKEKKKDEAI